MTAVSEPFWRDAPVLVTGAGGFIGSHLCNALVDAGATVTAFVRYTSTGRPGSLAQLPGHVRSQIRVVSGDLKDPAAVAQVVSGQRIVFHLGALIGIPYSYVHPIDYVQTNIVGTSHLLEACRHGSVEKIVQFSTSEVYGTAQRVPIDESHPVGGQSPYAASKLAADHMALSFHRSFDLPVAIARPFNTFGPRQPARAIIPTIITQALSADGTVSLGSLTPSRDLTFVSDTVAGAMRIAEVDAAVGEVINLGSGSEISVGDLAELIFELIGTRPRIETDPNRMRPPRSEVQRLLAGIDKARALLDWRPRIGLRAGLEQTIEWIREHPSFFQVDGYHV
jgi:NAD dependent epimerase/dehydratase